MKHFFSVFLLFLLSFHSKLFSQKPAQRGQTLVEFVFLLGGMFLITILILRGFNVGVANLWETYIYIIAHPTPSDITIN